MSRITAGSLANLTVVQINGLIGLYLRDERGMDLPGYYKYHLRHLDDNWDFPRNY